MDIKLVEKKDRDHILKNKNIKNVCSYLIKNPDLIYFVGDIVYQCYTYEDFMEKIREVATEDKSTITSNHKLISCLHGLYKNAQNLGDERGGLLEVLVFMIIKNKHRESKELHLKLSCYILIGDWRSNKSVDIGAWCCEKKIGDCIECKINENEFRQEHVGLMKDIKIKSQTRIRTAFISFSDSSALKNYITNNFTKKEVSYIVFFGRNDLKRILNEPVKPCLIAY